MARAEWLRRIAGDVAGLVLCVVGTIASAAIPASERAALLDLYARTNGAGWTQSANWNGPPGSECTWFGVTCDAAQTAVIAIDLHANNLTGILPADLGSFANLTAFSVFDNRLTGSLPQIGSLARLENFTASLNQFSGPIPPIAGLAGLRYFIVDRNQLSGSIPTLAGLTALDVFSAGNNRLTGPIPVLSGLANLGVFSVDFNSLTGTIPDLSGLSNLWIFAVSRNQLTGPIPSLAGLTNLDQFLAWDNQLSGALPSLAGLANLVTFAVQDNLLTGPIPSLAGVARLELLYVANNRLSGPIPDLSGLVNLREVYLAANQLTGPIPALTGLGNLQYFNVETNQLSGTLPTLAGLTNLRSLRVHNNRLGGSVPPVPSPSALANGQSALCPNAFNRAPDPAWDAATGETPWYAQCLAPPPAPPLATTTGAGAITQTGSTLNGTVTANGATTVVRFDYGVTGAYGNVVVAAQSPLADTAVGVPVSATIGGLQCGTLHHFRVVASNGIGGDVDGGDATFTTAPCTPTTVALSSSPNPSIGGATVVLAATVIGGAPTGSVTFLDGATSLGNVGLDGSGRAMLATSGLGIGSHALVARYSGDATHAPSSSGILVQVVAAAAAEEIPALSGGALLLLSALLGVLGGFVRGGRRAGD
jgi:Leucine-rich repeat (LRR) protein